MMDLGFRKGDSLFTQGYPVWTREAAKDLKARFIDAPDMGKDKFMVKFKKQLDGAPRATDQLAAELLYVYLLPPVKSDLLAQTKLNYVREVLSWSPEQVTVPDELAAGLSDGFAGVGVAYHMWQDRQLAFLIRVLLALRGLGQARAEAALGDPWEFRSAVYSVEVLTAYSMRNALLHLAFPDTFEDIVSDKHKEMIRAAFKDLVPAGAPDVDRALVEIRQALEQQHGGPIDFYRDPWFSQWSGVDPPPPPGPTPTQRRGWLVRGANVRGQNFVPDWLEHGYCSIGWEKLSADAPTGTRQDIYAQLAKVMPELTPRQLAVRAGEIDLFINQMREGDLVATVDGKVVHLGTITGPLVTLDSPVPGQSRRRSVSWFRHDPPLRRDQLSTSTQAKLKTQLTVSSLGAATEELARLIGPDEPPHDPLALPDVNRAFADRLLIGLGWLNETVDLLREKRQLILYGPPGTGKTYIAQALAEYLAQATGGGYRLVQFHPSYSYEDFFEGFRPRPGGDGGTISFDLEPGPFKMLAAQAAANPGHAYILVIDEINRANLAKVFGELYFLLEYRDREVSLQYSPKQSFQLPDNLFVIGTMNTSDRSIALVDSAMRRRFNWQSLFPDQPPVKDLLRRWLHDHNLGERAALLLDRLNARIEDKDGKVGPSYLMTERAHDDLGIRRIWEHQILPLLEERHAGEGVDVRGRYGVDALESAQALLADPWLTSAPLEQEAGEPST